MAGNREQDGFNRFYGADVAGADDSTLKIDLDYELAWLAGLVRPSTPLAIPRTRYYMEKGHLLLKAFEWADFDHVVGRRVLDVACGPGYFATLFALRGAQVDGVDLSEVAVATARRRAALCGVADRCRFHVLNAQDLNLFANATFDLAFGSDALHHLHKYPGAIEEIARVLKPGGRLIFASEPLGMNPLFEIPRRISIHLLGKAALGETTLSYGEMRRFVRSGVFASVRFHEAGLAFQLKRLFRRSIARPAVRRGLNRLYRLDAWLLDRLPFLRRFCGEVTVEYRKAGGEGA